MLEDTDFFLGHFNESEWLNSYDINYEKMELFKNFILILLENIDNTFLGDGIDFSMNDIKKHFQWSFNETIKDFEKENIFFNTKGYHNMYIFIFLYMVYYNSTDELKKIKIEAYIKYIFDVFNEQYMNNKNMIIFYNTLNTNLKYGNT